MASIMEDPERAIRLLSELIGIAIGLVVLNQATGGEVVRMGRTALGRVTDWWDHSSLTRMMLDAAAGAPATIREGERWAKP